MIYLKGDVHTKLDIRFSLIQSTNLKQILLSRKAVFPVKPTCITYVTVLWVYLIYVTVFWVCLIYVTVFCVCLIYVTVLWVYQKEIIRRNRQNTLNVLTLLGRIKLLKLSFQNKKKTISSLRIQFYLLIASILVCVV